MESESTEIDFRSLEDELYDNEITQILSQPNTAESMYMFNYRRINIYFVFFYTDTNRDTNQKVVMVNTQISKVE